MRAHREVRHLGLRITLFTVGAALAFAGMWADVGWLVDVAIAVLLVGFALRFFRGSGPDDHASLPEPHPDV